MKKRMVLLVAGMSICLFAACGTKNETGNDVTISSKEAQALSIGAIFPGGYFIGREESELATELSVEIRRNLIDINKLHLFFTNEFSSSREVLSISSF